MGLGTIFGIILLASFDTYANMSWLMPIIIFLLMTYAVGALFMYVYAISAETLLFCITTEY